MKKWQTLTLSILSLLLVPALAGADQALYMRHPALSPDLEWVAFSYRGDIWRVPAEGGRAERLTVHPGRDLRPIWSPNGDQIAFASNREGQNDIFVMPAEGGAPRRLTFNTGSDFPCDWSPRGDFILAETYAGWRPDLVEIPLAGGPARPVTGVPSEGEYFARYRADGDQIVFCDGGGYGRWWWEGNRSSRAGQVWTLQRGSWPPEVNRVSPEGTQFLWPAYSGDAIVATSNADGVANIVRLDPGEGLATPVTTHRDAGVRWLRTARDGSRAVFERNFRLWQIDLATDSVTEIRVEAPSDWVQSPRVEEDITGKIESFSLAPDGRRIAFVARGEIYLIPAEEPKIAHRLTRTDARERFATFSPDGKTLTYVSDRNGRQNLFMVDTRSGAETALTNLRDLDVARPQYMPAGDKIAFYLGNNRIASVTPGEAESDSVATPAIDTILLGRFFDFPLESTQEFRFSPDGKYVAYTAFGTDYNTDIWVYALDGSTNVNMTRRSQYNYDPCWSPNGKYLTFAHVHRDPQDLFALRLEREAPEFAEARLDSLYEEEEKKKSDDDETDELPDVNIDFERAHSRWQRIMPMSAGQWDLTQTPDGKYWLFIADLPGGRNIWRVPVAEDSDDKPMQLTKGKKSKSEITVDAESKIVYYLEGGRIGKVGIDGKEQELLSFGADYDYHPALRNEQKLTEVWRTLGNYFYDPNLHGADWDTQRAAYAAMLPHVALQEELHELLREFIGNLNASHLNIYGGVSSLSSSRQSGYLGLEFAPQALAGGQYVVDYVYPEGPLDLATADVEVGDTLTGIAGISITSATNLDSLLTGTIGERVRLTFAGTGGTSDADVKPISRGSHNTLRYEDWVAGRRRLVDSLSSGRLGYLHVRSMNQTSLNRFKRELADQTANYEGLVIDVRYNGGGWIAVHLLGMLERQPFVLRNFRGAETVSENKSRSFAVEKPMILLINHFSASNSEILAEGWRQLNLGKIVGYPTCASVIGTAAYRLIDGTVCRRPSWGAYTVDMENLEGNGRMPDILLFNTQNDWISGRDPQLAAAAREILADLR